MSCILGENPKYTYLSKRLKPSGTFRIEISHQFTYPKLSIHTVIVHGTKHPSEFQSVMGD